MHSQNENNKYEVLLRPMTEADIPLLLAIDHEAFGEDEALDEDDFWVPLMIVNNFALVAECDGAVAGFMLYQRDKMRGIYLSDIAVSANQQGKGIATRMIVWLKSQMKQLGRSTIVLHVKTSNEKARRLYEALGFERDGIDQDGYGEGQDACVMTYSKGPRRAGMSGVMMPLTRASSSRKAGA